MSQKPDLPEVAPEIKARSYQPSGKCPPLAVLAMIVGGAVSGPIILVAGFIVIGWLLGFLLSFMGNSRNNGLLILGAVIAFLFYFIISGLLVGAAAGGVITGIGYAMKSRSWVWNLTAGFLAVGASLIIIFTDQRQLIPIFRTMEWFDWLYLAEFCVATIAVAAISSFWTFCESCNQWYKDEFLANLPLSSADHLLDSINKGLVDIPDGIQKISSYPHLKVSVERCPNCEASDEIVNVKVMWKEAKENAVEESADWLSALVPSTLGKSFREKIQSLPVVTEIAIESSQSNQEKSFV